MDNPKPQIFEPYIPINYYNILSHLNITYFKLNFRIAPLSPPFTFVFYNHFSNFDQSQLSPPIPRRIQIYVKKIHLYLPTTMPNQRRRVTCVHPGCAKGTEARLIKKRREAAIYYLCPTHKAAARRALYATAASGISFANPGSHI